MTRPKNKKNRSRRERSRSKPPRPPVRSKSWRKPLICLGLLACTWIVFGRTVGFDFVNYDDSFYVYQNPSISNGLTSAGLVRAFTHPLVGNWHPLTSISLMLDAQLFGLNPSGYHLVNLLLHTGAVLLLFLVLAEMTGAAWRSAFVAALFAIHPLRVESVVWISERKDVLSALFFGLTLWAYLRYARKPPALGAYLLVVACYLPGLLSKAMLVTLPFLFLLLDYWPLQRWPRKSDLAPGSPPERPTVGWLILEKVPLLALVIAISFATFLSQEHAMEAAQNWPLRWRVSNALVTVWIYLGQMIWPADLAVFYPHPEGSQSWWIVGLSFVFLLVITAAIFVARRRFPYLFTGWFWYLGMLVPVIGLVQVGRQGHADRYSYLPQVGVYLLITWGIVDLTANWRARRLLLSSAAVFILATLMSVTYLQTGHWANSIRLWTHTLAVTENNDVAERGLGTALLHAGQIDQAIAHDRAALRIRPGDVLGLTNLANALLQKKEFPEAIEHFREVMRLRPNDSEVRRNLGKALDKNGAPEEAMAEFRAALRLRPNDSDAAYCLGNLLLARGQLDEAIASFRQAIAARPTDVAAHYNLAIALNRNGALDAAMAEFRETLRLQPNHAEAHNNLAIALLREGRAPEAIAQWEKAVQLQPAKADFHHNLASGLLKAGRVRKAVEQWRETLRLQPDKIATRLSLAWILSTSPEASLRDGPEALQLIRRARELKSDQNPMLFRVLAAAFAETGQFTDAAGAAEEGAKRAEAQGQGSIATLLRGDLALYRENVPLRDRSHGAGTGP